jgi:hypothetical protein
MERGEINMSSHCSRTKAFAGYGLKLKNVRSSLSARCEKEAKVAISVWQDEFKQDTGRLVYDRSDWGDWYHGPSRRELIENLLWAREHLNGHINVVVCIRKRTAQGYVLTDSFARQGIVMRIARLDQSTGAFRLEQVLPERQAA